jgi:electron transport complex protein RnfB
MHTDAHRAAIDALELLLPQTQCTQCGYAGCRPYAEAIVMQAAPINRCPPGGSAGIAILAAHTGQPIAPLDPDAGIERPRRVAYIVAELCIGCTKCIEACPVDAIAGAPKRLHAVIVQASTGCDLCLPPCPVDCIQMVAPPLGQEGWSRADAQNARARHARRAQRIERLELAQARRLADKAQHHLDELDAAAGLKGDAPVADTADSAAQTEAARKRAVIEAAVARARARLAAR